MTRTTGEAMFIGVAIGGAAVGGLAFVLWPRQREALGAIDCSAAQAKLRAARGKGRAGAGEAWDISNTMRAHGCPVSLDGLKRRRRRRR